MKYKNLLFFLPVLITCCSEDDLSPQQGNIEIEEQPIVLGQKLPNPYSLNVMQKAAEELATETTLKSSQLLQPTH